MASAARVTTRHKLRYGLFYRIQIRSGRCLEPPPQALNNP